MSQILIFVTEMSIRCRPQDRQVIMRIFVGSFFYLARYAWKHTTLQRTRCALKKLSQFEIRQQIDKLNSNLNLHKLIDRNCDILLYTIITWQRMEICVMYNTQHTTPNQVYVPCPAAHAHKAVQSSKSNNQTGIFLNLIPDFGTLFVHEDLTSSTSSSIFRYSWNST